MSQYECETVRIAVEPTAHIPDGFIVINKSDFDPAVHKLHGVEPEPAVSVVKQEATATTPSWKPA